MKKTTNEWLTDMQALQNSEVRDLFWCIFSPDLLDSSFSSAVFPERILLQWRKESLDWFRALDQQPEKLFNWISTLKTNRLGYKFEHLVCFFFHEYPEIELLANNIQYSINGITQGEIDFLIRYQNINYHIEVSVKFYCQFESGENLAEWIGPSSNDRLDLKWNHLISHQLPLIKQLKNIPKIDFSFSWMKGVLYPINTASFPPFVNKKLLPGIKIKYTDFMGKTEWKSKEYWLLDRPFWLSDSHLPSPRLLRISFAEIIQKIEGNEQHIQTLRIAWQENGYYKTGFILKENWPNLGMNSAFDKTI